MFVYRTYTLEKIYMYKIKYFTKVMKHSYMFRYH